MKSNYDFSKAVKNPYADKLKKQNQHVPYAGQSRKDGTKIYCQAISKKTGCIKQAPCNLVHKGLETSTNKTPCF